jgi:AcrR family transcriptional regulator
MKQTRRVLTKEERRGAILDVAGEVFSEEGYAAASMSDIASRLGGSKGTLYNYFRNKEALFAAHVEAECQCRVALAFEQPMAGDEPLEALTGLAERLLDALASDESRNFYALIVSEARRTPSVGRIFYESGPRRGIGRIAEFLERAQAQGTIATDDCTQAAGDFLSLIHGGLPWRRLLGVAPPPTEAEIREEAGRVAGMFMRAYGVRD